MDPALYDSHQDKETTKTEEIVELTRAFEEVNTQEKSIKQFSILDLPKELVRKIYPYFDHASRTALRGIAFFDEICLEVEQIFDKLKVDVKEDGVHLSFGTVEKMFAFDEAEKEMEAVATNKFFNELIYKSHNDNERRPVHALKFFRAKKVEFWDKNLDYSEFLSVVQNKEELIVHNCDSSIYMDVYKYMLEQKSGLKFVRLGSDYDSVREKFMAEMGISDFYGDYCESKENQLAFAIDSACCIIEEWLRMIVHDNFDEDFDDPWAKRFSGFVDYEYVGQELTEDEEVRRRKAFKRKPSRPSLGELHPRYIDLY